MHSLLLLTHSVFRYFILIFLLIVILRALVGIVNKKEFSKTDDQASLGLFILTHMQLLIGLILYFISPAVIFESASMKNPEARYWLVEHNTMMLIAIVLITLARTTSKKMNLAASKHKRLFIFNILALLIIVAAILSSGRGFFGVTQ